MTYAQQLKDPRWQKKRLEILERDGWACRECGAEDKTLHVHHTYYERGKMAWEHNELYLLTLCEGCHERTQRILDAVYQSLGINPNLLEQVFGYIQGCVLREYWPMERMLISASFADGIADAGELPRAVLAKAFEDRQLVHGHALNDAWWKYRAHENPWARDSDDPIIQEIRSRHEEYISQHGGSLPSVDIGAVTAAPTPLALKDAFLPHLSC